MMEFIKTLLTGMDRAERKVLQKTAAAKLEQERNDEFLEMIERLPAMLKAGIVHSTGVGDKQSFSDAGKVLNSAAKAIDLAMPYARNNPKDFRHWYENHGPGRLFGGDALRDSKRARDNQ